MAALSREEGGYYARRPRLCQSERRGPCGRGWRRGGREAEPEGSAAVRQEWETWVYTSDGKKIRGRLIIVRRSKLATEYARKKLKQEASKKQTTVSAES